MSRPIRFVRFGGATYRQAGVKELAKLVLGYLWDWIVKAGLSKQQVLDWITSLLHCDIDEQRNAGIIPTNIVNAIARVMAGADWNCGDFLVALEQELERPPAGYRWKTDKLGRTTLIKHKHETEEKAIVRGKRFADDIFIGVWWTSSNPRGSANQLLQRMIRRHGAVFWNEKLDNGSRQYGGFLIAAKDAAEELADQLCVVADRTDLEGGGEHRLSAIGMVGIAEHREVRTSDQVWVGCIRSIKFNWKYNLDDLLNGRVAEFKGSAPYRKLIETLRSM